MAITSLDELKKHLTLKEQELSWKEGPLSVPLRITDYYFSLINKDDPNDPLRIQVVPNALENTECKLESSDPLKEVSHSHGERLIHRYTNRVAFLTTDLCPQYCRHCFRRRFTGNMVGPASKDDILSAASYIKTHKEVKEMLLTGGDVLTLSNDQLDFMIGTFRNAREDLILRICTRYVAVEPSRIDKALIDIFKKYNTAPFFLLTQFNHPRELTKDAINAVSMFVDAGISAFNQTVLLKGVNDNVDTLEELCNKLLFNRIKPYYLFQGDLVSGTSCFRVPVARGLEIENELRQRLSGLAMPNYTADLPNGGGKIPLGQCYIRGFKDGVWTFATVDGSERSYPDPQ